MSLTLAQLAVRFGCELQGDPGLCVDRVATLSTAGAGALSFLANPLYRRQLEATRAAAVVVDATAAAGCPVAALIHPNPYATYARIAALLYPPAPLVPGIHPTAIVESGAQVHADAQVGPWCVIGAGAQLAAGCTIAAGCVIGSGVALGAGSSLRPRVTLEAGVRIGPRALIHAGTVIGADGFGFARDGTDWVKVPQVGAVQIGADVEIGANTTIDRGAIDDTVIGDGVKIDNQVQIAHNCVIGNHTVIAAFVGISGSTRIGQRCMIGGSTVFVGHLDICDDVAFTGNSMITRSISRPGVYSGGIPAEPARLWRRLVARLKRMDALSRRVRRLEQAGGVVQAAEAAEDAADD